MEGVGGGFDGTLPEQEGLVGDEVHNVEEVGDLVVLEEVEVDAETVHEVLGVGDPQVAEETPFRHYLVTGFLVGQHWFGPLAFEEEVLDFVEELLATGGRGGGLQFGEYRLVFIEIGPGHFEDVHDSELVMDDEEVETFGTGESLDPEEDVFFLGVDTLVALFLFELFGVLVLSVLLAAHSLVVRHEGPVVGL